MARHGSDNNAKRRSTVQAVSPGLLTSVLDHLVVPGLVRFTRFGFSCRGLGRVPVRESLAGRTVVLTGATAGLGRAAAHRLAALGARLVVVGRDPSRLAHVRDEIARAVTGAEVEVETADL
jgi:NADPH:quinone reductase-like Zn-dependent oxidoreductase